MARILVVDDSSIMRRNLCTILKNAGHSIVSEASNGEQAVKEYEKTKPDLVTMDITMPELDGIGAVKKIVDTDPDASVIMISAMDQKFMVLTAIQNGAKHYIIKPFTPEKVVSIVNEVLMTSDDKAQPVPGKAYDTTQDSFEFGVSKGLGSAMKNISSSIADINNTINGLEKSDETEKKA